MKSSKTFVAIPPGETIKEMLIGRNMTQKEFSMRLDISEKHLSHIINGEVLLTYEMAEKLESVFGVSARFWKNLEAIYRETLLKIDEENEFISEKNYLKKFPYSEMVKNGFIKLYTTIKEKIYSLRQFFEVANLNLLEKEKLLPQIACRRLCITDKTDNIVLVLAQKAKLEARNIVTKPISIKKLVSILPLIRNMTTRLPAEFSANLVKVLSDCGIALVFLPNIKGSFLHGVTFKDKNKIIIGITMRGKDSDKFWFSLFHEIGHVVLEHLNKPYGLEKCDEMQADRFSSDNLIPSFSFNAFVNEHIFTKQSINQFAHNEGIHTGIIVGRLQKEGYISYSKFNDLKLKYDLE